MRDRIIAAYPKIFTKDITDKFAMLCKFIALRNEVRCMLHCTAQQYATQHSTAQHSTAMRRTAWVCGK